MLKRFIFWDFPRASWQYDVMVGIILAFIFLTPREWFRDQPRIPHAGNVAMLPSATGTNVFWIEPELLANVPESGRKTSLTNILRKRTGNRRLEVFQVEPIYDSEKEVKGFMALAKP